MVLFLNSPNQNIGSNINFVLEFDKKWKKPSIGMTTYLWWEQLKERDLYRYDDSLTYTYLRISGVY